MLNRTIHGRRSRRPWIVPLLAAMARVTAVLAAAFIATAILVACSAPVAGTPAPSASPFTPLTGEGAAYFTLMTAREGERMTFVGRGGTIDGIENPALHVHSGDRVEVILINGDSAMHDIVSREVGLHGNRIVGELTSTVARFTAPEAGTYPYYCTVPGHRAAGMEGLIVVAD